MRETLTISLPAKIKKNLLKAARQRRVSTSEFVRRALEREIFLNALEKALGELVPKARAMGIFTDEDVFRKFPS